MKPQQITAVVAEGSLIAASIVAAISLERLFVDSTFLRDVLLMAVASHLVAIACRRARFKFGPSAIVSGVTLVLLGSAIFYPNDSSFIFPTTDTISALTDDLSAAGTVFVEESAPVQPLRGFVVSASALVWIGAFLADSAAFRLRSFVEAIAFATLVLAFSSLMGIDRNQVAHGVTFTAALTAVALSMRALERADDDLWTTGRARPGVSTILRSGAMFGLIVVVVGALVAPRIPGADSQPLVDITGLDDPPSARRITSPLVNVSASLVEQSDEEIFSVRVAPEERDYWRLMALTEFDGDQWQRTSSFDDARGPLPSTVDSSLVNRTRLVQTVSKRSRSEDDIFLPAAYELSRVLDDGGVDLEYEVSTGALVYHRDSQELAEQGFSYTIESQVPDYEPSQLQERAAANLSEEFLAEHTQLPPVCEPDQSSATHDCWPTRITVLARQVTASAATDYQRARMLQDFLRDPANFRYDLDVAKRHDIATTEDFLFSVRAGYCEQFASVFASMARSIGIPTRVAVGYTWGSWDPERREYVVRGHHAHAWPEVYFAEAGWIIFEPTPGRSRPHDSDITGLTDAHQYPSNESLILPGSVDGAIGGGATNNGFAGPPVPRPSGSDVVSETTSVSDSGGTSLLFSVFRLAFVVVVGVTAATAGIPAIKAVRRRRRLLRAADDPVMRGEIAWDDAVKALRLVGFSLNEAQTPLEVASAADRFGGDLGPLEDLAVALTALRYSDTSSEGPIHDGRSGDVANELALAAKEASARIVDRCHTLAGPRRVTLAAIDPRSPVKN